jgi:plasmid stabilization system protein ParE
MRKLAFRPEALVELKQAKEWYEDRATGLGLEFARAIDAAIAQIQKNPTLFPSIAALELLTQKFRYAATPRFPYFVIFAVTETEIVVISCFHYRRAPGSWAKNLLD